MDDCGIAASGVLTWKKDNTTLSERVTNDQPPSRLKSPQGDQGIHESARREKLKKLRELGIDPWGGRFDDHQPIGKIRGLADQIVEEITAANGGERTESHGPRVRAAGRIMLQRRKGKLVFADIQDWSGRIQLFIGRNQIGEDNWAIVECLDLGDIIGVDGELKRTKTGELTIFSERIHFLTKAIEPPPDKHSGLSDVEVRQRMRYLDLAHTEGVLDTFLKRTKIIRSIRDTLAGEGYVEIEGPTLHTIAGGAAARPFQTHHNALDIPLTLRIALELHLKRLLVGGMERVFELGRVYRNEGISPKHNPEFTMLEVYQAYGDYCTMMDLTESVVFNALAATGQQASAPWGESIVDYSRPFARQTYNQLFEAHVGVDPHDERAVRRVAESIELETGNRHPDVIKNEVFEERVEPHLTGPVFVLDYPASICPLTKRKADDSSVAERFELFIQGMEVANAYTELNDPDLQEELFRTQLAGQREEDSMAKMDRDFIRALRQGMPPAGGLGIGIDRLVMLLTNNQSIREVILFPLFKPERE